VLPWRSVAELPSTGCCTDGVFARCRCSAISEPVMAGGDRHSMSFTAMIVQFLAVALLVVSADAAHLPRGIRWSLLALALFASVSASFLGRAGQSL
jgi:hypothetical protein